MIGDGSVDPAECGTEDEVLVEICRSVSAGALILRTGGLIVDRPVTMGESGTPLQRPKQ